MSQENPCALFGVLFVLLVPSYHDFRVHFIYQPLRRRKRVNSRKARLPCLSLVIYSAYAAAWNLFYGRCAI